MRIDGQLNVVLHGRKFKRMMDQIFKSLRDQYGLKQIEIEVLFYLFHKPEDSASDIVRNLYLNKGHVSQAINGLCANGFLIAYTDEKDHRFTNYKIMEKGDQMIREIVRIMDRINEQLFKGLSDSDLQSFVRLTDIISQNIDHTKNE